MRIPRYYLPGAVHHVITRFVDRYFVLDTPGAREKYLELLERSLKSSDWRCLSYGLMSSHTHNAMVAGEEEPEQWLKRVHSPFAVWINKVRGGLGPVIAARPDMRIVDDASVGKVLAYIHNNPVRAGVVAAARDSQWTSHRAYLGVDPVPRWLCVEEGMRRCALPSSTDFDLWVQAEVGGAEEVRAAEALSRRVARAFHRKGIQVATPTIASTPSIELVRRREGLVRPEPREIIEAVAFVLDEAPAEAIAHGSVRLRRHVLAAGRQLGLTITSVSAALGITPQHGSKLLRPKRRLEDALIDQAVALVVARRQAAVEKCTTVPRQARGRIAGRRVRG